MWWLFLPSPFSHMFTVSRDCGFESHDNDNDNVQNFHATSTLLRFFLSKIVPIVIFYTSVLLFDSLFWLQNCKPNQFWQSYETSTKGLHAGNCISDDGNLSVFYSQVVRLTPTQDSLLSICKSLFYEALQWKEKKRPGLFHILKYLWYNLLIPQKDEFTLRKILWGKTLVCTGIWTHNLPTYNNLPGSINQSITLPRL